MSTDQLAARLERLERSHVRVKRLAAVLGLLLAATFAGAMDEDGIPDVIRAGGFEVIANDGSSLASLSHRENGSVTLEFDGPGDGRLSVGVHEHDELGIILSDRRKIGRVVLALDGTAGDPYLYLMGDPGETCSLALKTPRVGSQYLEARSATGVVFALGTDEEGAVIEYTDESGFPQTMRPGE